MCQLNAQQLCEIVELNITNHKGEQKLLTEWREIINNELPRSRRMTPRELAMVFKTLRKDFKVEKYGQSYSFLPIV